MVGILTTLRPHWTVPCRRTLLASTCKTSNSLTCAVETASCVAMRASDSKNGRSVRRMRSVAYYIYICTNIIVLTCLRDIYGC